jgi:hypothetical protein
MKGPSDMMAHDSWFFSFVIPVSLILEMVAALLRVASGRAI